MENEVVNDGCEERVLELTERVMELTDTNDSLRMELENTRSRYEYVLKAIQSIADFNNYKNDYDLEYFMHNEKQFPPEFARTVLTNLERLDEIYGTYEEV